MGKARLRYQNETLRDWALPVWKVAQGRVVIGSWIFLLLKCEGH